MSIFRSIIRVSTILVMVVVFGALMVSCPNPAQTSVDDKSISITSVGWIMENIDPNFFTSTPAASCFGEFSLSYTGSSVGASDISYARMITPWDSSSYWTFSTASPTFDATNKKFNLTRFYNNYLASNGSVFPIGSLQFQIKLTNGNIANYTFNVPEPGSLSSNSKTRIYNEDFTGTTTAFYARIIRRPSLTGHSLVGSTATVNFTLNDTLFYNGYVWVYDGSGAYVGVTGRFRTDAAGTLSTITGGNLKNDGSANTITFQASDVIFQSGFSWSNVSKFALATTDGQQYAGTKNAYDCRSVTALTSF